ncbi:hypothetical protein CF59_30665 [Escherichia coli]|nr:hypothetical protein CF59_30665 [Escherichia coli]
MALASVPPGAWRSPVADGVYTSLGAFKGTYNGSNTTGENDENLRGAAGIRPTEQLTQEMQTTVLIPFPWWLLLADR